MFSSHLFSSSVSISLCSMTQSLSGSGQTFCSPRGLSGPPPSAAYAAAAMEAEQEVFMAEDGEGKQGKAFEQKVKETVDTGKQIMGMNGETGKERVNDSSN